MRRVRKEIALLLVLALCLSLLPTAFAENDPPQAVEVSLEEEPREEEPEGEAAPPQEEARTHAAEVRNATIVDSGTTGESLTWTLDSNGLLTISGTGFISGDRPWLTNHTEDIRSVVVEEGVTQLSSYTFSDCVNLVSVSLPMTLTSCGDGSFRNCSSLTSLTIPDGVTSFGGCSGCTSLTTVRLPETLISIGEHAFEGCSSLKTVNLPAGLADIWHYAFSGCSSLTGITIPSNVRTIGMYAFYGCSSLESVTIPAALTTRLEQHAFEGCSGLRSLTIQEGVTDIGYMAFFGCNGLTSITVPASLTSLGNSAFSGCRSLCSIQVADGNTKFKSVDGVLFSMDGKTLLTFPAGRVGAYEIPEGVKTVRSCAFRDSVSLASLTVPRSVTSIEGAAFLGCDALTDVYYKGPADQWHAIVHSMENDPLKNATLHALAIQKPEITGQPASLKVNASEKASFTVEATGDYLQYQWYYRAKPTDSWAAVSASSGKTATYTLTAAVRHNGYQYRCEVKNELGQLFTEAVTLTVTDKPVITVQPQSITVTTGLTASFTVQATGSNLQYQWYYKAKSSDDWTAVKNNGTAATYTLTAAQRHNGYRYRCRVKNSEGRVFTPAVTLTVSDKPEILAQPASVMVKAGETASFTVKAAASNLHYQWYYKATPTSSWTAVKNNGTSATYTLTTAERHNGYQYRCRVKNSLGRVFTQPVTLTVDTSIVTYRYLLVGQNYTNVADVSMLFGSKDLSLMKALFTGVNGAEGGGFTGSTLTDASYNDIKNAIASTFADADEDDVSFFYYSGHGVETGKADYYAGALVTVEGTGYDYLPLSTLASWLKNVPGKVVVLLDSCGSGAAIYQNGVLQNEAYLLNEADSFNSAAIQAFAQADEIRKEFVENAGEFRTGKFYVLTAATYNTSSVATSKGSLFTLGLKNGVMGSMPADTNGDGKASLHELFVYIENYVSGSQQTKEYPANSSYQLFAKK